MPNDCDVIVIGSGAGGGTFAYACARAGKSVLLFERGSKFVVQRGDHDEKAMLIDKKPYDERPVQFNGYLRRLYMGSVLGGGTALYGAALMRPSKEDFHPGKHYGCRISRAVWDWPVDYHSLEPHYAEAEKLYAVSGSRDQDFGPLQKPSDDYPAPLIPVKPINKQLMDENRARGLKPFRLPLAIDFDRCLQCGTCPGYICPTNARHASENLTSRAAANGLPLSVVPNTEAEHFIKNASGQVDGVAFRNRATGKRSVYRAARYILAAGAINSPGILIRSGLGGPWVGRNYMYHLSPVTVGLFRRPTGAEETFIKQVGFHDYYFGTQRYAHKLGLIQSLPIPGPLLLSKGMSTRLPSPMIHLLRRHMLPLAGIVEDLPLPSNRVHVRSDGTIGLHHRFDPYDLERGARLGRLMGRILKNAGALLCIYKSFPSEEHIAHQCGTLRFGKDRHNAVLDPDCRLFGRPNVFVVDASFFPTSLGVGPALTIMANALRVAAIVVHEL
jgi:choline dehydrogenase-like flavoprotein